MQAGRGSREKYGLRLRALPESYGGVRSRKNEPEPLDVVGAEARKGIDVLGQPSLHDCLDGATIIFGDGQASQPRFGALQAPIRPPLWRILSCVVKKTAFCCSPSPSVTSWISTFGGIARAAVATRSWFQGPVNHRSVCQIVPLPQVVIECLLLTARTVFIPPEWRRSRRSRPSYREWRERTPPPECWLAYFGRRTPRGSG